VSVQPAGSPSSVDCERSWMWAEVNWYVPKPEPVIGLAIPQLIR
jgi:hypothetical protein